MDKRIGLNLGMNYEEVVEKLKKLPVLPDDYKESGHKFVLTDNPNEMIISITGDGKPKHGDLGKGKKVITAGYFNFELDGKNKVKKITFDNKSKAFCKPVKSLEKAEQFITSLLGSLKIESTENTNPDCDDTHFITKETPFYETSPQQGRPPDGMLSTDEHVRLTKNDSNYPQVELKNRKIVYVDAKSLKAIERKS